MGHAVESKKAVYFELVERLNKYPVGAPEDPLLLEILHRLYSSLEAFVGSKFPLMPATIERLSRSTGLDPATLGPVLESMAEKGLVIDFPRKDTHFYMLAPMVVGFFEYTFMRIRGDVDYAELARLFEKYFDSKNVREEVFGPGTKMFRALMYENIIPVAVETEVLRYEKASEIIRASEAGALSMCACRHKAQHLGTACKAPLEDICISLGSAAEWLVRRGMAKKASVDEMLSALDRAEEHGLVHLCDNVMANPTYICNCCGCCCGVLRTLNESGISSLVPSDFRAEIHTPDCVGCGACLDACHVKAISLKQGERAVVSEDRCIGCGACAHKCKNEAIYVVRLDTLYVPPATKNEQLSRISKERGR